MNLQCKTCAYQANKNRKAANVAQGLCPVCGKPVHRREDSKRFKYCLRCSNQQNRIGKARKARLLEKGLCAECGQSPHLEGITRCSHCKEKRSRRGKELKDQWRQDGLCSKCGEFPKPKDTQWCERCLQRQRQGQRVDRENVIVMYGGRCACCGESNHYFLTIDHINRDGAEHRRQLGNSQTVIKALAREPYNPDRYQLLCYNCNCSKEHHGTCPHTWAEIPLMSSNLVKFRPGKFFAGRPRKVGQR